MNLSKSKCIAGLQCLKRLYLKVHNPELEGEPDEKTQAVFEQGHEVGRLAQQLCSGGQLIDAGPDEMSRALRETRATVEKDGIPAIYEATFAYDQVLARIDVLERLPRNKWRMIEVKSSTSVKEHYVYDVAIQRFILEGLGMKVVPCLMHLNREYVYDGKRYDLKKLFVINDLTTETDELESKVKDLIREERKILAKPVPPDIEPGRHCDDPYTCEFYDHCNQPIPVDHVENLPGITQAKLDKLAELGVKSIGKIPKTFPLNERQMHAWECAKTGKPWFDKGLKQALADLEYPLYFMDFETLGVALPRYAGMSPYSQIPFQWSVHVQRMSGAELEHHEFLAEEPKDPRPAFIDSLCQVIGTKGSIVAYNSGFESGCLGSLAKSLPKRRTEITRIQDRLWDLLPVVRNHTYHPEFRGSYSLKSVLPALVPDMTYEGMEVKEGSDAGLAWEKMLHGNVQKADRERLREALLAYCKKDTLAMVRLLDVLRAA